MTVIVDITIRKTTLVRAAEQDTITLKYFAESTIYGAEKQCRLVPVINIFKYVALFVSSPLILSKKITDTFLFAFHVP
jgi:hypothetical protein